MSNAARYRLKVLITGCLLATFAVLALTPAHADTEKKASQPSLVVELNNLEAKEAACRLSMLIENQLGAALDELTFELVLFDKDQRITSQLAVKAGALPKDKSRVMQFDLQAVSCTDIGRILFNSISKCSGPALTPEQCLAATTTRSRTEVKLTY